MLQSSVAIFLPRNIPGLRLQPLACYVFQHNNTHSVLDLDYGSILNHHEKYNVQSITMQDRVRGYLDYELILNHHEKYNVQSISMQYLVRGCFMCKSECSKIM